MSDRGEPGPPEVTFRSATLADLPVIVRMLADDPLAARREEVADPLPDAYHAAFEAIQADPNNTLLVAERVGQVVGVLQLTFMPSLTYRGGWRAQIEGVRVVRARRGEGIGQALMQEAIRRAEARGCRLVQLTTDKARPEALRFYERLGFQASHEGLKLRLGADGG